MNSDRRTRAGLIGVLAVGLLALTPVGGTALEPGGTFGDDDGSVHEASIEAIADVGITLGCNPPVNDLYCPNSSVTREQMATFLVRALSLAPASGSFTDTAGSVHEANIGALAAAGITLGCNPPANDLYCPDKSVTRAQMATFLTRALNLDPVQPPPPLPDESPSPLVVIGSNNWLYFTETVQQGTPPQSCAPQSYYDRALFEIGKAKEVVTASGRNFVYTVVPNKAAIYSDDVPDWAGNCAEANSTRLRQSLTAASDPSRVELWEPFLAAADQRYFKHDTHWNGVGSSLGAELIAEQVAPGVWDQLDLVASSSSRQGDLAGLIGVDWVIDYEELTPTLTGVTPIATVETATIAGRPVVTYASASSPQLSSQSTAIIHDSFGLFFRNDLGPLFEQSAFLPMFSHPITDDARPFVVISEQIVFEVAARNGLRATIATGTAGHLAAALAADFVQTPVTFVRDGLNMVFDVPGGDPADLRYLIVEANVAATVVIGDLYELAIGPTEGAWPNEITPDATRYGFEIMDSSGPVVVELPDTITITGAFVITIE